MKNCQNVECQAENPDNALFCRKCGTAFKQKNVVRKFNTSDETFTLDTFKNISFYPVSVEKIRFVNRFVLFLFFLLICFLFLSIIGVIGDILMSIDWWLYQDYCQNQNLIELICIVISCLMGIIILKYCVKKLRYKLNADYIENSFINDDIVRIAKKSQIGLFDKKKQMILLPSNFTSIEKFDNQHLLICKDNKKGLYSLTYRKIIIPILFDSISPFVNYTTSVVIQGRELHYDIRGNKLI